MCACALAYVGAHARVRACECVCVFGGDAGSLPKSTWTHVFTDSSAKNAVGNGGSGAYIRRSGETTSSLSIPAGDLSSNYRAEVHALKAATDYLIEEDCKQQNIVLLTGSLSALQSLTNGPTDLHTQQLHNSLCTLSNNNRVVLQPLLAHVGIAGNENADRLAKAVAELLQPHLSTSYKEVKTLSKQKQKSAWRLKKNPKKPMDITQRKTRLTPLTGGPKPPSTVCALWAKKISEEIRSC